MKARLQFRELLNEHGLPALAGSEAETVSWLEQMVIQFADAVTRRERLQALIQQTKNRLERGQEKSKVPQNGERTERPNPYIEARFRRIKI